MEIKRIIYQRFLIVVLLVYQSSFFIVFFRSNNDNIDGAPTRTLSTAGLFQPMTSLIKNMSNKDMDETKAISLSLCEKIDAMSSFQHVWEQKKESIMKVSLVSNNFTKNIRANQNFTKWVKESMSFFTYSRLQHSMLSRPMDQSNLLGRMHSILEQKLAFPDTSSPLQILVFGGSVTMGTECEENIFNYPVIIGRPRVLNGCSWPARLQDMIDEILGVGVVIIRNMAVSGATTDMATSLMEFGLIPGSTPDVIVWDHGVNDNFMGVDSSQQFSILQKFYQATLSLPRACDFSDPPLVIFLDSFLGGSLERIVDGLRSSSVTSKMVMWYPNIWGISYANTLRPYVLFNDQHNVLKLLGSDGVRKHPGMMYHISIAWTILFNLLYVLHDNCIDQTFERSPQSLFKQLNDLYSSDQLNKYLRLSSIPELNNELKTHDVPRLWTERIPEPTERKECLNNISKTLEEKKKITKHSSSSCFYVWMVNRMLRIFKPQEILNVIQPYLAQNEGWSAFQVNEHDKVGWQTKGGQGSYFELQFDNVPPSVNSLTIIYMQSYSEKWLNSTLQIDINFVNPGDTHNSTAMSVLRSTKKNSASSDADVDVESSNIQHTLSGYHEEETSVQVPTKLMLPNRTLEDGKSTLRLQFYLLDGERFKIMGMAIC